MKKKHEKRLKEIEKVLSPPPPPEPPPIRIVIEGIRPKTEQPPLGLKPKWLHNEQRMEEIREAIIRYSKKGKSIPSEWVNEYNALIMEAKT